MREQLRALVKCLDQHNWDVGKIVTKDGLVIAYESPTCKWVCVESIISTFVLDGIEMGMKKKIEYLGIPAFLVENVPIKRGETFFVICDSNHKKVYQSNAVYDAIERIDGCFYALFKKEYIQEV